MRFLVGARVRMVLLHRNRTLMLGRAKILLLLSALGVVFAAGCGSTSSSSGSAASSSGGASASANAASVSAGPGVTAKTIAIGIPTSSGLSGAAAGPSTQAQEAAATAVVTYVNGHGGLAGRQVVPNFFNFDAGASSWNAQYQAVCAHYTQDTKVFAELLVANPPYWQEHASCLAKGHTVLVASPLAWVVTNAQMAPFKPYFYVPQQLAGDQWGAVVDMLDKAGYFAKGAKVGVLYENDPATSWTLTQVVEPRLAHYGIKVADAVGLSPTDSFAAESGLSSQQQAAVLKFKADGVDHVFVVGGGYSWIYFPAAAQAQHYFPRYAMTSADWPSGIPGAFTQTKAEMKGAIGVGWMPGGYDLATAQQQPNAPNQLCQSIEKGAGNTWLPAWLTYCDGLFFLQAALKHAAAPAAQAMAAAVDKLGTSWTSVYNFSNTFDNGNQAGAGSIRLLQFNSGCTCFQYNGPTQKVS